MKRAFFAVMVLLISLSVSAIEWSVPESIPENVNWSIYADLSSASYDRIQVFLDGEKVYETSWGSEYINYEMVVSARYYDIEKKLAISFAGLKEGAHSIEIKILKEGSEQDSVSKEINVFVPGSMEMVKQTKENFLSMRNSLDKLREEIESRLESIDSLNASLEKVISDISSLESEISNKDKSLESIKASINTLKEDFSALSKNLGALSENVLEKDENVNASLAEIEASIGLLEERVEEITKPPQILTGFFSFVQGSPALALALLLVIIIAVILVLLKKKRASGMLFETGELESEVHAAEETEETRAREEKQSGRKRKWSFGEGEEESKRFHLSDLLWKKK